MSPQGCCLLTAYVWCPCNKYKTTPDIKKAINPTVSSAINIFKGVFLKSNKFFIDVCFIGILKIITNPYVK